MLRSRSRSRSSAYVKRSRSWRFDRLLALLQPPAVESLVMREGLGLACRALAYALLVLTFSSLLLSALPLRLSAPEWYLQRLSSVAESSPLIMAAFVFGFLALYFGARASWCLPLGRGLRRFSRLLSFVVALCLVLQFGSSAWLIGKAFGSNRDQIGAVRSQANAFISDIQAQTTKKSFLEFLASRSITADLKAIEAAPLSQVKAELIATIEQSRQQQEQQQAIRFRRFFFRNLRDLLQLFVGLGVFLLFLRTFNLLVRRTLLPRQ